MVLFAGSFDYIVIDQVSFPIPLLRLKFPNIFFYCHYPDKLLSTNRGSCIMKCYRFVLDTIEELTTAMSKVIVVNSNFTRGVFRRAFPLIRKHFKYHNPEILYPAIKEDAFKLSTNNEVTIESLLNKSIDENTLVITSLNRYERKKNINLAIEAFAQFEKDHLKPEKRDAVLVIAGGYDPRVQENVGHARELEDLAEKRGITATKVVFLKSISNDQRLVLL